jgi:hypothetical protein
MADALESIPVISDDPEAGHHGQRVARLRDAVGSVRTRAAKRGLEFYLFVAGAVLVPLGLIVILLGWYGASHSGFLFEQVPYLISGGMLGVGLVIVGAFSYFAYWLTRIFHQQREQAGAVIEALERLEKRLADLPLQERSTRTNGRTKAGAGAGAKAFVATASGTMFHRPDCTVVSNRPKLRPVGSDAPGMEPCRLCNPLGEE